MGWDLLDFLGNLLNVLDLFTVSSSSSESISYDDKPTVKKKTKYFTEKASAGFMLVAAVLSFFVFKAPLPEKDYFQTLIVISIIGIAVSAILFFILHILELYYFKNLFKLLLFSISVILFFISLAAFIYFRSGLFL
ncbi:branched-chain amino acid ABC transporter substrate-binding protein [Chryseobacterium shigense]|uniref:Glucan phosphoethanolaminetransferase (Alkaline phosphatase superfamily) n=1 Tax=Chryseobacterium shigense TaxID=297244 RepID=A0A841N3L9_9FLAO|nr:branched-chain amino acid ABC transporter substrate-binding protein [Chryseobacterium shigense]MBB6369331.1 glucan phosphoethanolaminetransferase (alkaline phosphatase superfamily) [Chryseobacterium shigense]